DQVRRAVLQLQGGQQGPVAQGAVEPADRPVSGRAVQAADRRSQALWTDQERLRLRQLDRPAFPEPGAEGAVLAGLLGVFRRDGKVDEGGANGVQRSAAALERRAGTTPE